MAASSRTLSPTLCLLVICLKGLPNPKLGRNMDTMTTASCAGGEPLVLLLPLLLPLLPATRSTMLKEVAVLDRTGLLLMCLWGMV